MKWIYTIILIVGALLVDIGAGAKTVEVTLTQAGTLNAALSDNGMQIDTLVVKGPTTLSTFTRCGITPIMASLRYWI